MQALVVKGVYIPGSIMFYVTNVRGASVWGVYMYPWGKCPGGTCPGGLYPRTIVSSHSNSMHILVLTHNVEYAIIERGNKR